MRLDEVEETGRQAMLQGFERIESDISDLTLVRSMPLPSTPSHLSCPVSCSVASGRTWFGC